ncbi:hypothetical protein [Streptosporangium sp. KLBMP 9127]|nr:hypothetical protein [Streptosporangium sp. KLBMP 9127]
MSKGLARRLAALGAGVAMAATMVSGLFAAPAAASAGTATSVKPKVSASTPKASPKSYEGGCPVKVTFSSTVTVKPTKSKTPVVYRWLRSDGSKSKVKSYTLSGKSKKSVTFKETGTFKRDVKGWQRLQVLSPRNVTSSKGYFAVDCQKRIEHKPPKRSWVKAYVEVDRYSNSCYSEIDAVASIRVGKPSWVKYRWIQNGRVVDTGSVKVWDDRRVHYSFRPRESHRGWVALEIVRPKYTHSNRAYYKVSCDDDAKAYAQVSAPADYEGSCPVAREFSGTVDVRGGSATVHYRWVGPNYRGPLESLYFSRHSGSKSVSHTANASESGTIKRWIEIVGPNNSSSNVASTEVKCKDAAVTASISNLRTAPDNATCGSKAGPAVKVSADIAVTGPTTLTYQWRIGGSVPNGHTTVKVDKAGDIPVTMSTTPGEFPTTAGKVTLEVLSPNAVSATKEFSHTCPTA